MEATAAPGLPREITGQSPNGSIQRGPPPSSFAFCHSCGLQVSARVSTSFCLKRSSIYTLTYSLWRFKKLFFFFSEKICLCPFVQTLESVVILFWSFPCSYVLNYLVFCLCLALYIQHGLDNFLVMQCSDIVKVIFQYWSSECFKIWSAGSL